MTYLTPYIPCYMSNNTTTPLYYDRLDVATGKKFAWLRYNSLNKNYYGYVTQTHSQVVNAISILKDAMAMMDKCLVEECGCVLLTEEQYKRIGVLV